MAQPGVHQACGRLDRPRDRIDHGNVVAPGEQPLAHGLGASQHAGATEDDRIGPVVLDRADGLFGKGRLGAFEVLLQLQHRDRDRTDRSELLTHAVDLRLMLELRTQALEHGHDAEGVPQHRGYVHRRLARPDHRDGDALAPRQHAGIAHAVDHHRIAAVALGLDDLGDRPGYGEGLVVLALDRGRPGLDLDMADR